MTTLAKNRNADRAELAKFGALAHRWWDPESELFAPLHKINRLRSLDRAHRRGTRRQARPRRRLRWRHPFGVNGGAGRKRARIDLSEKALASAKPTSSESGATVDYRLVAAGSLPARSPVRSTS